MKVKNNINYKRLLQNQKINSKKRLEKFAEIIKIKADEKTPIDSKELIGNTKKSQMVEYGNKIFIKVYNDTEYAYYVEYGVRGEIFNYHKYGKKFTEGVGAGFFSKTAREVEGNFKKLTD